jgi:hypothetical protein
MKILIDGKEVPVQNDVKVIYEEVDGADELHLTLTHEGIISDVIADGEVIATQSQEAIDIHGELINSDFIEHDDEDDEDPPEFYAGHDEPDAEIDP